MTGRICSVCEVNKRPSALTGGSIALIKGPIFSRFPLLLRAGLKSSHVGGMEAWRDGGMEVGGELLIFTINNLCCVCAFFQVNC